jgi:NDP-sugar pyrophosphorylase family protein
MVSAMVLAAGLGTRLRPLTDLCAKPLVPVGDRPALAHALGRLDVAGVTRKVVNAHHRADEVGRFVESSFPGVHVSVEVELLGTAGGIARASDLLGPGDVVLWNADILADLDVRALVAAHEAHRESPAEPRGGTLVVQPLLRGQGSVGLDPSGRVVRIRQQRIAEETCGGEFLGIHVLGPTIRAALPARGCVIGDGYIPAMEDGARLQAFVHRGPFFDVGTPRRYLDANLAWLAARGESAWLGHDARRTAGVVVEDTVVGAGAILVGEGTLRRCVVWPGATASAPLADAIVAAEVVVCV